MVHQVGHAGDRAWRAAPATRSAARRARAAAARGSGWRDRRRSMIRTATPRPAAAFKAPADDGSGLGAEVEVVLREVERALCGREERRQLARHVERLLAAVGQSSGSDGASSSSDWPTPASATRSTSIVTAAARRRRRDRLRRLPRVPARGARCSSSARRRATAAPASPGSRSPRSGSSPARGPAEATATIVHGACSPSSTLGRDAALERRADASGDPGDRTNRRPTRAEIEAGLPFLRELARGRRIVAVGRLAQSALGGPYVRHPSRGGAAEFRGGAASIRPGGQESAAFSDDEDLDAKPGEIERDWYVVDAEGKTLGRLATQIADMLRGKRKPQYTPHVDTGDFVVVVNAEKIAVTGKKLDEKMYYRHSGYPGGLRSARCASSSSGARRGAPQGGQGHAAREPARPRAADEAQDLRRPRASARGPGAEAARGGGR